MTVPFKLKTGNRGRKTLTPCFILRLIEFTIMRLNASVGRRHIVMKPVSQLVRRSKRGQFRRCRKRTLRVVGPRLVPFPFEVRSLMISVSSLSVSRKNVKLNVCLVGGVRAVIACYIR